MIVSGGCGKVRYRTIKFSFIDGLHTVVRLYMSIRQAVCLSVDLFLDLRQIVRLSKAVSLTITGRELSFDFRFTFFKKKLKNDSCWRNKVSNFRLGHFAIVVPFWAPNVAYVDILTFL